MSPRGQNHRWSQTTAPKYTTGNLAFLTLSSLTSPIISQALTPHSYCLVSLHPGPPPLLSTPRPRDPPPPAYSWDSPRLPAQKHRSQGQGYLQCPGVGCAPGIMNWNSGHTSHTALLPFSTPYPQAIPLSSQSLSW